MKKKRKHGVGYLHAWASKWVACVFQKHDNPFLKRKRIAICTQSVKTQHKPLGTRGPVRPAPTSSTMWLEAFAQRARMFREYVRAGLHEPAAGGVIRKAEPLVHDRTSRREGWVQL